MSEYGDSRLRRTAAGPQQHVHLAGDALLRGQQQRLDVAAHRVEQLPLVHQSP